MNDIRTFKATCRVDLQAASLALMSALLVSANDAAHANCVIARNAWHPEASRSHRHYAYQMDGGGCTYVLRVERSNGRMVSMDVVQKPKHIKIYVSEAGPDIRVTMTNANGFKGQDFYRIRYCHRMRNDNIRCGLSSNSVTVR